jgi:hypothetical protein
VVCLVFWQHCGEENQTLPEKKDAAGEKAHTKF